MYLRIETLAEDLKGLEGRIKETEAVLIIDYPLYVEARIKLKSKTGFTKLQLAREIGKAYLKIYASGDKYGGIWGHNIGDLVLEGMRIRRRGGVAYVTLIVGS